MSFYNYTEALEFADEQKFDRRDENMLEIAACVKFNFIDCNIVEDRNLFEKVCDEVYAVKTRLSNFIGIETICSEIRDAYDSNDKRLPDITVFCDNLNARYSRTDE